MPVNDIKMRKDAYLAECCFILASAKEYVKRCEELDNSIKLSSIFNLFDLLKSALKREMGLSVNTSYGSK